jgi:hypothetical protein
MATIEQTALPVEPRQRVLVVAFRSTDGRSCTAVGGGPTDAAAIDWARESCPVGVTWDVTDWDDLYGE